VPGSGFSTVPAAHASLQSGQVLCVDNRSFASGLLASFPLRNTGREKGSGGLSLIRVYLLITEVLIVVGTRSVTDAGGRPDRIYGFLRPQCKSLRPVAPVRFRDHAVHSLDRVDDLADLKVAGGGQVCQRNGPGDMEA
jgi:hypothetical protein